MISQNRTAQQDELRAQLDYETNVKAEREIKEIINLLREVHAVVINPPADVSQARIAYEKIEDDFKQLENDLKDSNTPLVKEAPQ